MASPEMPHSIPMELMVEGFGISLTEASACGVPVIGGSDGGIPDAVRDGETGLLVDASYPEPVLVAVRRLLGDRELARRMGAAGRRAVETYYNWDRVAADVIALGREVGLRNAASPGARISGFGGSPIVRAARPH